MLQSKKLCMDSAIDAEKAIEKSQHPFMIKKKALNNLGIDGFLKIIDIYFE